MDKCVSFYVTLFMLSVVIATVTSFGGSGGVGKTGGGFGGDVFNRKYQTWLEKRGSMGGQGFGGFGSPLGSENRYFNWKDYLAGVSKRQLNYGPRNFGNFQSALSRYFTDGLQDWKSTFTGGIKKREAGADAQNDDDNTAEAAADTQA